MMRTIVLLVAFMLSGCINPYVKHYQDNTRGADISQFVIPPVGEPKLVRGTDPESETLRMLENGYGLLGRSLFNGGAIDTNEALEQAKAVHAEIVTVYASAAAAQTRTTPKGRKVTRPGGTQYLAMYWVKMKPPVLGASVQDLTTELKINTGTKTGVYVTAVVKDSAAAGAGIVRGDVIRKIGDLEVGAAASFRDAVMKLVGQKVMVEIWRDHQALQLEVQLGPGK